MTTSRSELLVDAGLAVQGVPGETMVDVAQKIHSIPEPILERVNFKPQDATPSNYQLVKHVTRGGELLSFAGQRLIAKDPKQVLEAVSNVFWPEVAPQDQEARVKRLAIAYGEGPLLSSVLGERLLPIGYRYSRATSRENLRSSEGLFILEGSLHTSKIFDRQNEELTLPGSIQYTYQYDPAQPEQGFVLTRFTCSNSVVADFFLTTEIPLISTGALEFATLEEQLQASCQRIAANEALVRLIGKCLEKAVALRRKIQKRLLAKTKLDIAEVIVKDLSRKLVQQGIRGRDLSAISSFAEIQAVLSPREGEARHKDFFFTLQDQSIAAMQQRYDQAFQELDQLLEPINRLLAAVMHNELSQEVVASLLVELDNRIHIEDSSKLQLWWRQNKTLLLLMLFSSMSFGAVGVGAVASVPAVAALLVTILGGAFVGTLGLVVGAVTGILFGATVAGLAGAITYGIVRVVKKLSVPHSVIETTELNLGGSQQLQQHKGAESSRAEELPTPPPAAPVAGTSASAQAASGAEEVPQQHV